MLAIYFKEISEKVCFLYKRGRARPIYKDLLKYKELNLVIENLTFCSENIFSACLTKAEIALFELGPSLMIKMKSIKILKVFGTNLYFSLTRRGFEKVKHGYEKQTNAEMN